MRKILMLLLFSIIFSLISCTNSQAILLEPYENAQTYVDISSSELAAKMDSGSSFMLYISSESCSSCAEFKIILDTVIQEKLVKIYKIEAGAGFITSNTMIPYSYTPSIAIIKDGKVVDLIDAVEQYSSFSTYEGFIKYYNKYILPPEKTNYNGKS